MGDEVPTTEAHIMPPPRIRIGEKKEVTVKNGTFVIKDEIYDNDYVLQDWVVFYSKLGRNN